MKAAFAHSVRQFGVSAVHELRTSADMNFPSHGRRERSYTDVFQVPIQHGRCPLDGDYR